MGRRLAAPFVATLALACTRSSETTPVGPDKPTSPKPPVTAEATVDAAVDAPIEFDGTQSCYRVINGEKVYLPQCPEAMLPKPPSDRLVYSWGQQCRRAGDGLPVQCPPGGATAILPEPTMLSKPDGSASIHLRLGSLTCFESYTVHCPPGVACNPPPPMPVPCPPALLPKLAPGVKPTKRDGGKCFFDVVEVVCPKP